MDKRFEYLAPVIPFEQIVAKRGVGNYIYDKNDNKILDINSGQFCAVLGHSNTEVSDVVNRSLQTIQHTCTSLISESVLNAAAELNRISGKLDARSLLLSTGSEAVETCLRYGKHITKKDGVLCFANGYHGLTLGSQSVTFSGQYAKPLVERVYTIEAPKKHDTQAEAASLNRLKNILDKHADEIGLIILEPVVSVGGLIYPDAEFFAQIRELTKKYGVLFAFDESQTGFGRTGNWFAYQTYGVTPDFVICSKAIGLGYPVAALLFSGELVENNTISMTHYSSHQNDPFAGEIISFGINFIERNNLLSNIREKGEYFLLRLKYVESQCKFFAKSRGLGLMLGLDFSIPGVENYRDIYKAFHEEMLNEGVLIQGADGGRVLRFLPGYLISHDEIDFCIDALIKVHSKLFGNDV